MDIRNIAIIAHVDHGKTTLTDALMKQCGMLSQGQSMDSNKLEQERGITIYSKNTSIFYKDTKINIVDTPGHSDFGSEVERILRSIDSVLLLVDAQEGPMPQTKFVLKKSLELGLKPIVVINKIDKPAQRAAEVQEMVYELFLDLGANDDQLDFSTVFAIARDGIAKLNMDDESNDLSPLLDIILDKVNVASDVSLLDKEFMLQAFNLGYDNYVGRLAICRIYSGIIKDNDNVIVIGLDGKKRNKKISKLFTFIGTEQKEIKEASAGDIVMIAGLPDIYIGETICQTDQQIALPAIKVDEPTISLNLLVNNSPFAGQDGNYVTNSKIKERLLRELEVNVGLKIDFTNKDYYKIYGRGELHIAILLENMRREGYEVQVSQPNVILKKENDITYEPYEEVTIDILEEYSGIVIEKISKRKGTLVSMNNLNGNSRLLFHIPVRGMLGYRNQFIIDTKGEGILCSHFLGFREYAGDIEKHTVGSMVSMVSGKSLSFALFNLQDRGQLYINPNILVYEGMIIGNIAKGIDLAVNPIKGKHLTNMRAASADEAIKLTPPVQLTIEKGLSIMKEDEYLEITPKNIRLRKKLLTENERIREMRQNKKSVK